MTERRSTPRSSIRDGMIITHSDLSMVNQPLPAGRRFRRAAQGRARRAGARHLHVRRPRVRVPHAAAARHDGVRIDSRRRLDAAHPERVREDVHDAAHDRRRPCSSARRSSRCCSRSCVLRPIHVIRSGLAQLGRGELDVNVDLPKDSEFGDLGDSFKAVTRQAGGRPHRSSPASARRSNRSSSTSRTPSRCSGPTARCSSRIPRCARRSTAPARTLEHAAVGRPSVPRARGRDDDGPHCAWPGDRAGAGRRRAPRAHRRRDRRRPRPGRRHAGRAQPRRI